MIIMVKYNTKIFQVHLLAILTIMIIANTGFVASASADNNVKVKVNCEEIRDIFDF